MASSSNLLVASIDVGTTFSGWAMSFKCDFEKEPSKVHSRVWSDGGNPTPKTLTAVLIKPDGRTLEAFGYDAQNKYMDPNLNKKNYFFFQKFKMMLYDKKTISRQDLLHAENGKPLPAILVFSLAIRFLKDDVLEDCNKRLASTIGVSDIHWTLTVPAIWNEQAKQFMRQAAIQAGIDSDKMTIVLEPEAAACFCRHVPFTIATDRSLGPFQPGSKHILIDCGGGTTDICCHEILENQRLKEIYKVSGCAIGGSDVDLAFEGFLTKLFGRKRMDDLKKMNADVFLDICRDFENKKKGFMPDNDVRFTIGIPPALIETKKIERKVRKAGYKDKITVSSNKIRISHACFREEMFDSVMERFQETVVNVCSQRDLIDVKTVILVGGFSECGVLQETVKRALPGKDVICIQDASLAVLKGAVIYGHDNTIISARIARVTYGLNHFVAFDPDRHAREKTVKRHGGRLYVELFYPVLVAGKEIPAELENSGIFLEPLTKGQPTVSCNLYASDGKDGLPEYVDDPRCQKLGKISAPITDPSVPLDQQEFQFKFKFGGTEVTATCLETKTGKTKQASIDILG